MKISFDHNMLKRSAADLAPQFETARINEFILRAISLAGGYMDRMEWEGADLVSISSGWSVERLAMTFRRQEGTEEMSVDVAATGSATVRREMDPS